MKAPKHQIGINAPTTTYKSTSRTSAVANVCVARQPIFTNGGDVVGYELVYRRASAATTAAGADRSAIAADNVIVHTLLDVGLERLTSGRPAYLNFTREMLLSPAHTLLPPESVVIELPESVKPDEAVEAACEELVDAGYTLALADFVWDRRYRRLLALATVVKVDVRNQPAARLDELAQTLSLYDVRLLAQHVETADVRAMCAGLGYELFQGFYFSRPENLPHRALLSDEMAIAKAMTVVRDPQATDADAEAAFTSDLGLSHKLLRMVNSAAGEGRGIESIPHALQLSGRTELAKWLALILVSSIAARAATNRELLHLAVQRGRMCELLGGSKGEGRDASALFLVGLFSLLDAISGIPMPQILDSISLGGPLRQALTERTGPYAAALRLAEAYEQGRWRYVIEHASHRGLDEAQVVAFYVQSLAWTRARLLSLALG